MNDIQIIELYWERKQSAISESSNLYGKMLKCISNSILSNHEDSDECVNDTYLKAWETIPPQKPISLAAYLGRIVRNISINRWYFINAKKRDVSASVLLSELADCVPGSQNVESEIESNVLTDAITKWLYSLNKDDRSLFIRRYWFGESLDDLASEWFTTPNKLSGRIYRLRQKLKYVLEKEGISL